MAFVVTPLFCCARTALTRHRRDNGIPRSKWQDSDVTTGETTGFAALREMRRTRRIHRVAEIEWFEALYRVYLTAIVGGGIVLFLSGLVKDADVTPAQLASITAHGPHVLGITMAIAVALGLRSGANGGPIAIEEPEVRHVLMSPVPHRQVLFHPAMQRVRSMAFSGAIAGAIAGQLAARRLPGSPGAWLLWGAGYGKMVALGFVLSALIAHGSRLPRWFCSSLGTALLVWQITVAVAGTRIAGPFDSIGSIALWPVRLQGIDIIAFVVLAIAAGIALVMSSRLSLESLARRSSLVAQLKFAVTLQDIRTVVLLRRQLSQEHMRERAWFGTRRRLSSNVVVARGIRSVAHFPLRRIGRMVVLTCIASASQVAVFNGTTPAVVISGVALFILGLDLIEPLSQEVDQPLYTDSFPVERGHIMVRHLVVPGVLLVPFIAIGIAAAFALRPQASTLVMALIVSISSGAAGAAGATVNAVKGAPSQVGEANEGLYLPPEVSGMTTMLRAVWPPAIAIIGSMPIAAAVAARNANLDPFSAALRTAIGAGVVCFLVGGWVRQRDAIHRWWRQAIAGSKPQPSSSVKGSS